MISQKMYHKTNLKPYVVTWVERVIGVGGEVRGA